MAMQSFKRKVARNRGNARVWLEKKCLSENGIKCGDRCNCIFRQDDLLLVFTANGERKVAGKDDRPIIDINTAKLNDILTATHYNVNVSQFDPKTDNGFVGLGIVDAVTVFHVAPVAPAKLKAAWHKLDFSEFDLELTQE